MGVSDTTADFRLAQALKTDVERDLAEVRQVVNVLVEVAGERLARTGDPDTAAATLERSLVLAGVPMLPAGMLAVAGLNLYEARQATQAP